MLRYGGKIMIVNKLSMRPDEQARMDYTNYMTRRQEANIEYIAMMTDVELNNETEEVENYGEQEI